MLSLISEQPVNVIFWIPNISFSTVHVNYINCQYKNTRIKFFGIFSKKYRNDFPNNCNTRLCDISHFFKKFSILHFAIFSISSKVWDIKFPIFNIAKTDFVIIFEYLKNLYIYLLVLWLFRPVVESLFWAAYRLIGSIMTQTILILYQ